MDRDPLKARQARNFGAVLAGFATGAVASGFLSVHAGLHAAWLAAGLLAGAFSLLFLDERQRRRRDARCP